MQASEQASKEKNSQSPEPKTSSTELKFMSANDLFELEHPLPSTKESKTRRCPFHKASSMLL